MASIPGTAGSDTLIGTSVNDSFYGFGSSADTYLVPSVPYPVDRISTCAGGVARADVSPSSAAVRRG